MSCGFPDDSWLQTPLSPLRRRLDARAGASDDAVRAGASHEARSGPRAEPGVPLANRERRAAAHHAHHARTAGPLLSRVPRLSGGRSGGVHRDTAIGVASGGREGGFVAVRRGRAILGRSGPKRSAAVDCRRTRFAARTFAAGGNFAGAWLGGPAARGLAARRRSGEAG